MAGRQQYAAADNPGKASDGTTDDDGVLHKLRLQHEMEKDLQGFDRITHNGSQVHRQQQARKKGSGRAHNADSNDGRDSASEAGRFFDESSISMNGQKQFAGFSMDGEDMSIELGRGNKEMGSPGHLISSPMGMNTGHSDTDMFLEDFKLQNANKDRNKKLQSEKENKKTTLSEVFDRIKTTDLTSGSESDGGRHALKPKSLNVPRSFKSSTKLMQDLNIVDDDKKTNTSFKLPNIPDLTMLLSDGIETGINADAYKQIQTIPIPEDEQAIFATMAKLRDKMRVLESDNANKTARIAQLEAELRRGGGNEPKDFSMARMKLDRRIAILSSKIELLQAQLDSVQVFSRKTIEERDEAFKLLSKAQEKTEKSSMEGKLYKRDAEAYKKLYQEALTRFKEEGEVKSVAKRVRSRQDNTKHTTAKVRPMRLAEEDEGIGRGDGSFSLDDEFVEAVDVAPPQRRREAARHIREPVITRVGRHKVSVDVESVATDDDGYSSAPLQKSKAQQAKAHARTARAPRARTVSAPVVQSSTEDLTGPVWINTDASVYQFDQETAGLSSKAHSILQRLASHNPKQCSVCAKTGK